MSGPDSGARLAALRPGRRALAAWTAPLLLLAGLAVAGTLPREQIVEALSLRLWLAVGALGLAASAAFSLAAGAWAGAALRTAALAVVLQGEWALLTTYDAILDLGQGESAAWAGRGGRSPMASPPALTLLELPERRDGVARLLVDGEELTTPLGRPVAAGGGLLVTVEEAWAAPRFEVRRVGGAIEAEGLMKLTPGRREEFEVGLLPHRFYVTLPRPEGTAVSIEGMLALRVQRGKLRVLERAVPLGEVVSFEGVSLRFDEGLPWARVHVRRAPPPWLWAAALVLLAVAGLHHRWRPRARAGGDGVVSSPAP